MEITQSSEPLLKCEVEGCGYSCNRADNLKIHLKNQHNITKSTQKKARFFCPVDECMKTYYHAKQLIDHLNEHNMEIGKETESDR